MLDFSFGELLMIGAVALVVLGPERLPRVARAFGEWLGKAQRYVSQVKADINREIEMSELKRLKEEAQTAAQSFESSVRGAVAGVETELTGLQRLGDSGAEPVATGSAPSGNVWESAYPWGSSAFRKRYRPGPSIDQLAEEVARLKRQLALPDSHAVAHHRYAPRARVNRVRIRR
jgi:sec-independent protein translocase protein TatB